MSRYKFFLLPLGFLGVVCIATSGIATSVHAADWRACEKAKLQQLNLEQTARANNHGGGKKASQRGGANKSKRSAEQIDEWLWKNCRDYSYELRNLEQQQM
jgi:hypothetical protein